MGRGRPAGERRPRQEAQGAASGVVREAPAPWRTRSSPAAPTRRRLRPAGRGPSGGGLLPPEGRLPRGAVGRGGRGIPGPRGAAPGAPGAGHRRDDEPQGDRALDRRVRADARLRGPRRVPGRGPGPEGDPGARVRVGPYRLRGRGAPDRRPVGPHWGRAAFHWWFALQLGPEPEATSFAPGGPGCPAGEEAAP